MDNLIYGFYALLGISIMAGAFKGIDWLISLKYMTKDNCSICRQEVAEKQSSENVKLTRIETKVDMLLKRWKSEA